MKVLYPALFEKQDDGKFLVSFPDFLEAITEGNDIEEAIFNASEVLTLTIEGRIDEKMEIPEPSEINDENYLFIPPAASAQSALLVRWARSHTDHTIAEVARAMNTSWPAISRLEDPHHSPNIKQLERVAAVLGQQLVFSMEPISPNNEGEEFSQNSSA
ncbi:type II toxin-antitoxin system HicB family antitoxin [Legionella pneumophila]|uniref:type II toxin-antitoxin system HicB family antitoxin n=1 Tax=Legionella pneumophila TaxID=446 RepID=UPI00026D9849|nr:type II toxin-antitoxin system HicB family antitoxin [Legionella pneumophila]MDW9140648.1 type II toxin-antitoxin system HicB family antitoxin [Legionella pneumophila]CCD08392.1 putative HTH-like transcriptional regulator, phage-related [Legionella pneumophila subsp. pneumophila]CZJ98135.1 Antitoxin HicB [Legionella pneumophila]CZR11461.1 Antitoxin HicB [Legionella pneumophila]STX67825.1 putative HTH-like transcriptional regulator, phage-related [Legionella pneumophila]